MKIREKICAWLFEASKKPYAFIFKRNKKAWSQTSSQLLQFPEGTLGKKVGEFLRKNQFELLDKLESHDVYHVITGMSTSVKDEVGMQFLLLGNGKRSLYLFSTVSICILLLPEYLKYFMKCYKKGKLYHPIHKLNLKLELNNSLNEIRWRLSQPMIQINNI
ncbi:MAG: hypothetical protein HUJ25_15770 [Crocinitomicaceae bacterium]|nr:hypothetical protein [Crocinitomicaceae bacterium]